MMTYDTAALRVLIADDHPIVREGIKAVLTSLPGADLVAAVATGTEAVNIAAVEQPDVVVMDLQLPDLDGIEATRRIAASYPGVAVLVLTMHDDDESLFAAIRAGARGYLLKGAGYDEIAGAIHAVARGGVVFGASIAHRLLDQVAARVDRSLPELSDRERDVLGLLVVGCGTQEIAEKLLLSPKTVRNHISSIFAKLHANSRAQAIALARDAGLTGRRSQSTGGQATGAATSKTTVQRPAAASGQFE